MTLPVLDDAILKETVWADDPALAAFEANLPAAIVAAKYDRAELTLTIERTQIIAAAKLIQSAGYNFLEDVTCVDWYPTGPRFQVTYHVLSHTLKRRLPSPTQLSTP